MSGGSGGAVSLGVSPVRLQEDQQLFLLLASEDFQRLDLCQLSQEFPYPAVAASPAQWFWLVTPR